jgi:hypothetical protein
MERKFGEVKGTLKQFQTLFLEKKKQNIFSFELFHFSPLSDMRSKKSYRSPNTENDAVYIEVHKGTDQGFRHFLSNSLVIERLLIEKHMHPLEKNVMYRSTLFSRPSKAFK